MIVTEDIVFIKTEDYLEGTILGVLGLECMEHCIGGVFKYRASSTEVKKYIDATNKIKEIVMEVRL